MATTVKEIEQLVSELEQLCRDKGLFCEGDFVSEFVVNDKVAELYAKPRLVLQKGSRTYGLAWRLHVTGGAYGTGHSYVYQLRLPGGSYLGKTKYEAYVSLQWAIKLVSEMN